MKNFSLLEYANNIYSQNGEDGIINKLLELLGITNAEQCWCVEFGAWDGKHLSNTFSLVERGWNAVYIEGDNRRFKDLQKTQTKFTRVNAINAFVGFEKEHENSLDQLLATTNIPQDYELLSIDIDSHDLAVWASYHGRPKIVIIEINSSIRPGIIQWHDGIKFHGNSFSATQKVAEKKGYTLVAHTGNMVFVRNDLIDSIPISDLDVSFPERLFKSAYVAPIYTPSISYSVYRLIRRLFARD